MTSQAIGPEMGGTRWRWPMGSLWSACSSLMHSITTSY